MRDWLMAEIEQGSKVLMDPGPWGHPFKPVIEWRGKPEDAKGHWEASFGLPGALRYQVERCLQEARRDKTISGGVPEPLWWGNLAEKHYMRGRLPESHDAPTPAPTRPKRAYGYGGEDKVVSLSEPDPDGLRKVAGAPREWRECLSDEELDEQICQWACACLDEPVGADEKFKTYEQCLASKARDNYYDGQYPRSDAQLWCEVPFDRGSDWDIIESRKNPGKPTSWFVRPNSRRPDFVQLGQKGEITRILEVKFPGDKPMPDDRLKDYQNITKKHTGDKDNLDQFFVDERCNCPERKRKEQEQKQKQENPEEGKSIFQKLGDALKPGKEEDPFPPELFPPSGQKPKPPSVPIILPGRLPIPR
ncbi:MAG: hypothetical protein LBU45_02860 [Azoarcus sp.]|nr:hypothetical protein [Azoarcus sp.]